MTVYYLAGPMTGVPHFNFPAFDEAASKLRNLGMDIISPAELDMPAIRENAMRSQDGLKIHGESAGTKWGEFLGRDIRILTDKCGGLILLPGWQKSKGARVEVFVAMQHQYPIFEYEHLHAQPISYSWLFASIERETPQHDLTN